MAFTVSQCDLSLRVVFKDEKTSGENQVQYTILSSWDKGQDKHVGYTYKYLRQHHKLNCLYEFTINKHPAQTEGKKEHSMAAQVEGKEDRTFYSDMPEPSHSHFFKTLCDN